MQSPEDRYQETIRAARALGEAAQGASEQIKMTYEALPGMDERSRERAVLAHRKAVERRKKRKRGGHK